MRGKDRKEERGGEKANFNTSANACSH